MHTPRDPGSDQIVYNGNAELMPLRGPSSQLLTFDSVGQTVQISWLPTDRRANDVEVRAFIMTSTPDTSVPAANRSDPSVLWYWEAGHGKSVVTEPNLIPTGSAAPLSGHAGGYNLPARGLVQRVTTRELKFKLFYYGAYSTGNPPLSVTCAVSFQPVIGMRLPPPDAQDVYNQGLVAKLMRFPPTANEWKLFDQFGQPYPAAFGVDILLYNITGDTIPHVLTPLDRALFADWTPIPPRAIGWANYIPAAPDANSIYVAYR